MIATAAMQASAFDDNGRKSVPVWNCCCRNYGSIEVETRYDDITEVPNLSQGALGPNKQKLWF